ALLPVSKTHIWQKRVSSIYARVRVYVRVCACMHFKGRKITVKNNLKTFLLTPPTVSSVLNINFINSCLQFILSCFSIKSVKKTTQQTHNEIQTTQQTSDTMQGA